MNAVTNRLSEELRPAIVSPLFPYIVHIGKKPFTEPKIDFRLPWSVRFVLNITLCYTFVVRMEYIQLFRHTGSIFSIQNYHY